MFFLTIFLANNLLALYLSWKEENISFTLNWYLTEDLLPLIALNIRAFNFLLYVMLSF